MSLVNIESKNDLSSFYVVYNGSVQNESVGNRGISHLMEHLMHNRNRKLYSMFNAYGIDHNALTSNTDMVFYISGLDKYVNKFKYDFYNNLSKLNSLSESKYALSNVLGEDEFQKEKKIVIQEYLDNFNDQMTYHHDMEFRKNYNHYGPIGALEDLKTLTLSDAKNYFNSNLYHPTKIINISKNNPIEKEMSFASQKKYSPLTMLNENDSYEKHDDYTFNKTSVFGKSILVDEHFAVVDFITMMLANGLNSPLYQVIREKYNLAYYIDLSLEPVQNKQGVITFNVLTDSKANAAKIIKLFEYILQHPDKFISEKRFHLIKRQMIIEYKKDEILNHNSFQSHLYDKEWDFKNYIEILDYDTMMQMYMKYFRNFTFNVSGK